MNKNITVKGGNCNHLRYVAKLIEIVRSGAIKPEHILTKHEPLTDVIEAYRHFDTRDAGWIKWNCGLRRKAQALSSAGFSGFSSGSTTASTKAALLERSADSIAGRTYSGRAQR